MWWCAFIMLVSPLPCLIVIVLVDAVPLSPPSEGYDKDEWFWWRVFVVSSCITATLLEQMRTFVPRLPHNSLQTMVWMTLFIGAGSTLYARWMASIVGFPLPFTIFFASPSWQILFWLCLFIKWGRSVYQDRDVRQDLIGYYKVVVVQLSLTVIYPAYNYIFIQLNGSQQTAFAIVLPLIKVAAKNAFSHVFQQGEDFLPEVVIFNVEIFHALFVACAMQGSTSRLTTAVLVMADIGHAWMNLLDVDAMLRRLQEQTRQVDRSTKSASPSTIVHNALVFVALDHTLHHDRSIRLQSAPTESQRLLPPDAAPRASFSTAQVVPGSVVPSQPRKKSGSPGTADAGVLDGLRRVTLRLSAEHLGSMKSGMTEKDRRLYVTTALRIFHFTEFVVLIEFVEVAVPLIYTIYIVVTVQLPNHVYYTQLENMDRDKLMHTATNLLGYVVLELLSFIGLCYALQRKLRFSPIRQLVFVLQTQWRLVQSKMILWVLFAVQISLQHFGYDYSFQFQWLKAQPPA